MASQVLRMTHENKEYHFKILNNEPIGPETREILLSVNGTSYTLLRENGRWSFNEYRDRFGADIAAAIGKTISLRYRI